MIEEIKYCSKVIKKNFNKELMMTKEDDWNFKNSTECWICDNDYVDNDVKVKNHCLITVLSLNHKIPVVFYNLKGLWFPSYYVRNGQIQS